MPSPSLPSFPRDYAVPAVLLLLLAVVWAMGGNLSVFLFFNQFALPGGVRLWSYWTVLGDALLLLIFVLPFVGRRPEIVWALWLAALLIALVVQLMKAGVGAPRPPAVLDPAQINVIGHILRSGSFPSGHTAAAFTFAGVLILSLRRTWVTVILLFLAAGVGVSRMAVGVHWPVDVLTGALLGWLCACLAVVLAQRWRWGLGRGVQTVFALVLTGAALVMVWGYDTGYPESVTLQRVLALAALLVAVPGLIRLARGRAP